MALFVTTAYAAYALQTSWGTPGSGQGQFSSPSFIALAPDGSVYVADTGNNRIQKFSADGAFVTAWGSAGSGQGQFSSPAGVAVGPDGTVYVSDTFNNRVQHFDANGGFVSEWGTPGTLDGQFQSPTGIAAGPDGSVYVGDSGNHRVERFLADGTFLSSFTSGAGGFGTITGVAAGSDGSVYVVDQTGARVESFDASGTFLTSWGSSGTGSGQFQNPQGVAAIGSAVYVADNGGNRVEKFTSGGAFADVLDAASSGDAQFSSPIGVAAAPGQLYVSQSNARMASYADTTSTGGGGASNLPPPVTGQTANAAPVSGTVKVKRPGSNRFELLSAADQIPIGSIVDVTNGTVALTTTSTANTTQTANFYSGVFKLGQDKSARPVTALALFGGNFKKACGVAGKASAARSTKRVVRRLWGVGKGSFRTTGRFASATIRGTQWLTEDRCDGTSVRVKQGSVTVRDLVRKRNVVVKAPKSYLVSPRPAR